MQEIYLKAIRDLRRTAQNMLSDEAGIAKLMRNTGDLLKRNQEKLGLAGIEIRTFNRMLLAHFRGEYRAFSLKSLVSVVAALLYFVNPFDIVPDYIPGLGFVDDISVIAFVMKSVRADIELFCRWEEENLEPSTDVTPG